MMTIPSSFKWTNADYTELNNLPLKEKIQFYKENEIKITLWECILVDILSPITFFADYYGGFKAKLITFVSTYATILFYYILFCLIT